MPRAPSAPAALTHSLQGALSARGPWGPAHTLQGAWVAEWRPLTCHPTG